ncbi:dDENN domain protein [Trichinella nativa]|uniref:DDENN domain protein n=1 Tax=Trichinella nativa TaxID=6335 RepID=A0A1Y3EGJ5_9BILA|nr:dDENN domain protein [Trichinella nativa]
MGTLLKDYQNFLRPIQSAPSVGSTDLQALFDVAGFLRTRDKASLEFYKLLMNTQLFIRFIEERSFLMDKDTNAYLGIFRRLLAKDRTRAGFIVRHFTIVVGIGFGFECRPSSSTICTARIAHAERQKCSLLLLRQEIPHACKQALFQLGTPGRPSDLLRFPQSPGSTDLPVTPGC